MLKFPIIGTQDFFTLTPSMNIEDAKQVVKSIILSLQNLYTHLGINACSWYLEQLMNHPPLQTSSR